MISNTFSHSHLEEIDEEVLANYLTKHYQQKDRSLAALERAVCLKMSGLCIGSERIDIQANKEKAKKAKGKVSEQLNCQPIITLYIRSLAV